MKGGKNLGKKGQATAKAGQASSGRIVFILPQKKRYFFISGSIILLFLGLIIASLVIAQTLPSDLTSMVPQQCLDAGILDPTACSKLMADTLKPDFGGLENLTNEASQETKTPLTCEPACGQCQTCKEGQCVNVSFGTPDITYCGQDSVCDGRGGCVTVTNPKMLSEENLRAITGETGGEETSSGGCKPACGQCQTCANGQCVNVSFGAPDIANCGTSQVCDGRGGCVTVTNPTMLEEKYRKILESGGLPTEIEGEAASRESFSGGAGEMPISFEAFMPDACKAAGVTDPGQCQQLMFTSQMPEECQKAGVSTPQQCEELMVKKFMPPDCKQAGAKNPEECQKIIIVNNLPAECKKAGIKDMDECEKVMTTSYGPKICQEKGATTQAECEKVVFVAYGRPTECEGLLDAECRRLIEEGKIAAQDFLNKLNQELSPKCIELGAKTFSECEKIAQEKNIPSECKEAGAFTRQACEKVMMEKFQPSAEQLPLPCQEAGATNIDECKKVMKARYFPQECQKAGIDDTDECQSFLAKKHLPAECLEQEVTTREACEELLRAQYMAPECKESGIFDEEACKELMKEKYTDDVECEGVSEEECEIAVTERHLGQIIKKQKEFAEVEEELDSLISKILVLGEAGEVLTTTSAGQPAAVLVSQQSEELQDILPIVPTTGVSLLVVPTEKQVVITQDESLIQTLPAAVMVDSDQDGVPNDIEINLGTNPKIADSDSDGFSDSQEIKNGFNPIGDGVLVQPLEPIEKIIIKQEPLPQPIINGEIVNDFVVQAITEEQLPPPVPSQPPTQPSLEPLPPPPSGGEMAPPPPPQNEPAAGPSEPPPPPPAEGSQSLLPGWLTRFFTSTFGLKPVGAQTPQKSKVLVLKGTASPLEVVTLYIYSDIPLIATTKTDSNGQWSYTLSQPLTDGEHKVYVALTDRTGQVIKKSEPFSLFIKAAQAISPQDFIKEKAVEEPAALLQPSFWQQWLWPIIISLVVIIFIIIGFGFWSSRKNKSI